MIRLHIKANSGTEALRFEAEEECLMGHAGWYIGLSSGQSFFMFQDNGQWKTLEYMPVEPELLDFIVKLLHPLALGKMPDYIKSY